MTADAVMDYISTAETTTTETYVDLATTGPTAAISVVNGQQVLIQFSGRMSNSAAGAFGAGMSFAVSGAATLSANDDTAIYHLLDDDIKMGNHYWISATSTATLTATAKYRRIGASGTATFRERRISVKKF